MTEKAVCSFLVIGDIHFKSNNAKESKILMKEIIKNINHYQPDAVVFLGDILNDFNRIELELLHRATSFLIECAKITYKSSYSPDVYVLVGNHDRANNQIFLTDKHPFIGLKNSKYPNLHIIDTPKDVYAKDKRVTFCPYVPEDRFIEALMTTKKKLSINIDLLFAHQDFSNIKMDELSSVKIIISGHIHDSSKSGNIFYPGTPYQHTFAESKNKGIYYVQLMEKKGIQIQKIELSIPKKETLEVTQEELDDMDISKLKNTRIIVKGDILDKEMIEKSKKRGNKLILDVKPYKPDGKQFRDIIYSLIADDKELKSIFESI